MYVLKYEKNTSKFDCPKPDKLSLACELPQQIYYTLMNIGIHDHFSLQS